MKILSKLILILLFVTGCSPSDDEQTKNKGSAEDHSRVADNQSSTNRAIVIRYNMVEISDSAPVKLAESGRDIPLSEFWKDIQDYKSTYDELEGEDFKNGTEYFIELRRILFSGKNLASYVTGSKVTDLLNEEIGERVINGRLTSEEALKIVGSYDDRPYSPRTLSEILGPEVNREVMEQDSVKEQYRKLVELAGNASGGSYANITEGVPENRDESWYIKYDKPILSLSEIFKSYRETQALKILLEYLSKGGSLDQTREAFVADIQAKMPEAFIGNTTPEFASLGPTRMSPYAVYDLTK